jgi:tight adherence protein B
MLIIVVLIIVVMGLAALYVFQSARTGSQIANRMGRFGLLPGAEANPETMQVGDIVGPQRHSTSPVTKSVERIVGRGRLAQAVYERLDRAQIRMTPAEFLTLCFAVLIAAMAIGLLLKGIWGMIGLGILGGVAPWFYLRRRTIKRRKAFLEQLADMAQMMANSMKAGFSIMQAFELVATEGPAPASEEFERVVAEVKLGLPLEVALEHLVERIPSEDLELMVVAINVQRQIGGNLAEILLVISTTIRGRVRFQRDVRTLTAQARYSSYIITALPVGVAIVINLLDSPYESMLYTTTLGNVMVGAALVMLALGFFFLNRIADIEV